MRYIEDVVQEELRRVFFSPTQPQSTSTASITSARNIIASLQSNDPTANYSNMHSTTNTAFVQPQSTTNMASMQPQFNVQTDKLNRKRTGSKSAFYKGKTPKVSVKEELRRLVALEYPGADVPEVDQFKDDMVIFDGLVRYNPEHVIREKITAKLKERKVSHTDFE